MDFVRSHFFTNEPVECFKVPQIEEKKCSTGQRVIHKEVTSYKIHTDPYLITVVARVEKKNIIDNPRWVLDWLKSLNY